MTTKTFGALFAGKKDLTHTALSDFMQEQVRSEPIPNAGGHSAVPHHRLISGNGAERRARLVRAR